MGSSTAVDHNATRGDRNAQAPSDFCRNNLVSYAVRGGREILLADCLDV